MSGREWRWLLEEAGDGEAGGGGGSLLAEEGGDGGQQAAAATGDTKATGDGKAAATASSAAKAASADAQTWWKGFFREDGTIDKTRLDHLPEEMKGDRELLARFTKPEDFFRSYAHHARLAREKGLLPLREGASEAEQAEFRSRLARITGAPEKPEGYGIKKPDNVPEEYWKQDMANAMAAVMHKHALSPQAVKDIVSEYTRLQMEEMTGFEAEAAEAQVNFRKEQQAILDREFGAFKEMRLKDARAGARWLGLDLNSEIFSSAAMVIAAAKVGAQIKEAAHVDGEAAAGEAGVDPQDELNAMARDPANKYYDALRNPAKNPRLYAQAIARQRELSEALAKRRAATSR